MYVEESYLEIFLGPERVEGIENILMGDFFIVNESSWQAYFQELKMFISPDSLELLVSHLINLVEEKCYGLILLRHR